MCLSKITFTCLLFVSLATAQTRPPATTTNQRYQLISAQIDVDASDAVSPAPQLFLLDTWTGRVWRYQPPGTIDHPDGQKEPIQIPELFIQIEILKAMDKSLTLPQQ